MAGGMYDRGGIGSGCMRRGRLKLVMFSFFSQFLLKFLFFSLEYMQASDVLSNECHLLSDNMRKFPPKFREKR